MEQRAVSEIINDLQPILRKFENDPGLVLDNAQEGVGTKLGDNFIAQVIRTIVSGKRGDGSPYRRSIMTKVLPPKEVLVRFHSIEALFLNEAHAYNVILPTLGDFGPKSLMANRERIMMEDVKEEGYAVPERKNFLNLDHVSLVLQSLATLHARSLALKLTNPEVFKILVDPLAEMIYHDKSDGSVGFFMETSLSITLNCFESAKPQTEEIKKISAYFERYRNKFVLEMQKLLIGNPKDHYVVCHGDPWTNNLMFKHEIGKNGKKGKVVGVKLVDFQISRYQSPASDFQYHIYTSASNDVIKNHYDDLISLYHETFIDELKRQKVPESKRQLFGVDWFKGELKKYALFGVVSGFCLAQAHLANEDQIKEMVEMSPEKFKEAKSWSVSPMPGLLDRITYLGQHFLTNFG